MAQFTFQCPSCQKIKIINKKPGEKIGSELCECGIIMQRLFKNINVGNIVDDKMIQVADTILNGTLPSGKSKIVF